MDSGIKLCGATEQKNDREALLGAGAKGESPSQGGYNAEK